MVVEAPDAVGAGGLEGVGEDEAADDVEVAVGVSFGAGVMGREK